MAESNGQDVQVPWFSGLCLEGEVAGQYEMERTGSQQEVQETTKAGVLELDGLAPITIFVGANNSGKSRLMRELFRLEKAAMTKLGARKSHDASEKSEPTGIDIGVSVESWLMNLRSSNDREFTNGWMPESSRIKLNEQLMPPSKHARSLNGPNWSASMSRLNQCGIKDKLPAFQNKNRCYIPILRGMRPPTHMQCCNPKTEEYGDLYKQRTVHDYFEGFSDSGDQTPRNIIFTGLGLFGDLRSRLLAKTQTTRDSVRKYEQFLSSYFFAGQEVILIPVEEGNNDVVHIKIGNKEERPIYDLGDGMQSLIICTYPVVTETEKGSLFFLEEPDLCMHPSLQRTFLEVLKNYHRKMGHQFFITTHSNHLLDLLEDNDLVSIFSFSEIAAEEPIAIDTGSMPNPRFRIRPSNLTDRQILLELGVRPSATYLANATIWVEGVSDCAYLRAYMEAFAYYLKIRGNDWGKSLAQRLSQYKEDRHYAFVEYSGANLSHYSFGKGCRDNGQAEVGPDIVTSVPNLCARAIVIADGDITTKGDRRMRFAKQLDERFIMLPCKEIENLIPEILMRSQVSRDYDHIDAKDLAKITYANYRTPKKGVGTYLSTLKFFKANYAANSGTLNRYRKDGWASNQKGIPWLLRQELKKERQELNEGENNGGDIGAPMIAGHSQAIEVQQVNQDLPSYLTQDLIWLCVCLYVHIAKCNHDQETEQKLKEFQHFIRDQGKDSKGHTGDPNDGKQPGVESENLAESAAPEWPIKDVERNCLLKAFLLRSNNAESTPSLNAEPNPASTSSPHGATAYPESLIP